MLLISQPQAEPAEMTEYYTQTYYQTIWPDADAVAAEHAVAYRLHEYPLMRALWRETPPRPGASVFEVGCGYGGMLRLLRDEGFDVRGCDPSPVAVAHCRNAGLDVIGGGAPGIPATGPFDIMLCQHVIEHLPDPRAFVRELASMTSPGGWVVIVTEDAYNAQWAWARARARLRGRTPPFHTSSDHTFVFSAHHLERLLREAGCDVVRTRAFSYKSRGESLHWRLYKDVFRAIDQVTGHGDYLIAVGRMSAERKIV
jgi:2-polyprenyl-3-methyl-5-hydroxy-6-metoxy-1,4-benzoquinol methylase